MPDRYGTTIKDTVSNLIAEVSTLRSQPPAEVEVVPASLIKRMEQFSDKSWQQPGCDIDRATAFLDFLIDERKKIMERFRKLIQPIANLISGHSSGVKLLKFVGIDSGRTM